MAKKSMILKEGKRKFAVRVRNRCQMCDALARLYAPLWPLLHLVSPAGAARQFARRHQVRAGMTVETMVTDPIVDMLYHRFSTALVRIRYGRAQPENKSEYCEDSGG